VLRLTRITGLLLLGAAVFATTGVAGGSKTTDVDVTHTENVCGIDVTIHDYGHFVSTISGGIETDRYELKSTFTSDVNGAVVLFHEEGQQIYTVAPVPNADGGYTFTVTYKGKPEQFKLPNGGMLTRDAGTLTITDTFDSNLNFLSETATMQGPHPEYDSGFALECNLLVPIFTA
jgi:hypothetical protein